MPFVSLLLPGGKRVGGYGYKTTKRRVQKKVGKYGFTMGGGSTRKVKNP